MARNAAQVIAIEALAAAQGCDFHAPLQSSTRLEAARTLIRSTIPHLEDDRHFAPELATALAWVMSGALAMRADVGIVLE